MAQRSKYLFIASMGVEASKEALFHDVYNTEHCPMLSQVPGVVSIARFETQPLTMSMGGETRTIVAENEPKFQAMYELESPEVLTSEAWASRSFEAYIPRVLTPESTKGPPVLGFDRKFSYL